MTQWQSTSNISQMYYQMSNISFSVISSQATIIYYDYKYNDFLKFFFLYFFIFWLWGTQPSDQEMNPRPTAVKAPSLQPLDHQGIPHQTTFKPLPPNNLQTFRFFFILPHNTFYTSTYYLYLLGCFDHFLLLLLECNLYQVRRFQLYFQGYICSIYSSV